ncbi:MAG: tautomerase family protein [Turicibacter sp.]|nr:tautomerase family protein [Turicibacter sp.]
MPHVVIKAIKGATEEQKKEAAIQIREVLKNTMGKAEKHTSVSIEEYTFDEWPSVYNENIKDKPNVILKPGYTDPVTFA